MHEWNEVFSDRLIKLERGRERTGNERERETEKQRGRSYRCSAAHVIRVGAVPVDENKLN